MKTMIKYLKLPYSFPVTAMQREVAALSASWMLHYNQRDYEGEWSALPLRSVRGQLGNTMALGSDATFADTSLMNQCPTLKAATDTLQCEKMSIRLLKLMPGAVIKEHNDKELSYEHGEARIHIPVMTHDDVEFYLDNERIALKEGECWYMNFNLNHRIINNSPVERIHLVIDCIVNDWMRNLFEKGNWQIKNIIQAAENKKYSEEELRDMIASLKAMNTPTSLAMAEQLMEDNN